jgi:Tfp pilus assembly protein PilW
VKRKVVTKIPKQKSQSGFSLVELLITCVIMLFVLAIMATIVSGVQSSYRVYRERAAKHEDALASLNLITRLIRNAGDNTTQTALTATGNNRLRIKSDWTNSDNSLDDAFEDVEFYVSNNTLYMMNSGSTSNTVEVAQNIQSVTFSYFDSNGAITSTMSSVARVNVTLTIAGESQSFTANASLRKMIQPR